MPLLIKTRFEFADRWQNAVLAQTWLGLHEISVSIQMPEIQKQIQRRKDNWTESPLTKYSPDRIALFGVDVEDQEETYLLWDDLSKEPKIVTYFESQEDKFDNLLEYIRHYIS